MSLIRTGTKVALCTLLSRIFGLVRELYIAQIFGVGSFSDSINLAFKLPNLFRRIFAEGALSSVFVPIFNSKLAESRENAINFSNKVFTLLIIALIVLVVLIELLMPYLMFLIAPGFHTDPAKFSLSILLCRITMPYLIFISVAAFYGGVLNSVKRFAAFAFAPVIFNLVIIITSLYNYSNLLSSSIIICYSVLLAGALQVVFMIINAKKAGFYFKFAPAAPKDKDVNKFLANMIPASLSAGTAQLNLFISQTVASYVPGAVSILAYADRIYQFPLSIIGISFGTILLPELSRIYKSANSKNARELLNTAIKLAVSISFPASAGIWILSKPIIHILYERGAFEYESTIKTAEALSAFSLGLPAFMLIKIITPIFYANHDQKTPLKITVYSMIINTALNLSLMPYFEHVGIALGSSISAWINALFLYLYSKRLKYFKLKKEILFFCVKVLLCCVIMSIFLYIFNSIYEHYYYDFNVFIKILTLTCAVTIGVLTFAVSFITIGLHKIFRYYNEPV